MRPLAGLRQLRLLVLVLAGCATVSFSGEVSRDEYGSRWPFRPDQGILRCDDANMGGGVRRPVVSIEFPTERLHGIWFALNGAAVAAGLPELEGDVWNGDRAALQPLVERGLELCG